jgi:hypothetical protein
MFVTLLICPFEKAGHGVDIQGAGYMFDPEIASAILVDKQEVMFTAGNLSHLAIDNFVVNHSCNMFCKYLSLEPLSLCQLAIPLTNARC